MLCNNIQKQNNIFLRNASQLGNHFILLWEYKTSNHSLWNQPVNQWLSSTVSYQDVGATEKEKAAKGIKIMCVLSPASYVCLPLQNLPV